jgi:hypothetical protein
MTAPCPSPLRYRVDPRGIAPKKAARRLGLTLEEFGKKLPALLAHGFPSANAITGNYDLKKIDAWLDDAEAALTGLPTLRHAPPAAPTMGERFRATKERKRHDRTA